MLINTKRRKARQNYSELASLLATPGDLTTGFILPADAELFASCAAVLAAPTGVIQAGTRTLCLPASAANVKRSLGVVRAGTPVSVAAGVPGTVSLYVRMPNGAISPPIAGGSGATVLSAARFIGNAQGAQLAVALGGVGATNFEVQALVYVEGARVTQNRIFMLQYPAGRQAGLFCSNVDPFNIHTGDSQVGSVGGFIGANPAVGAWYLMTFSGDGTVAPTGLWQGSIQSLEAGVQAYSAGGRTKGVEDSLTANRVDLNGGAAEFGWTNGIRFAEVRAYNAQRSQAQREADVTNLDPTGAVFWWRFSDNGSGGLAVTDRTGNNLVPGVLTGTLATGPTI